MPRLSEIEDVADFASNHNSQVGLHFQLECYVRGSTTMPSPFEGWATFTQIFQRRPDGARFAIARMVPLKSRRISAERDVVEAGDTPAGDWLCWDLLTTGLTKGEGFYQGGLVPTPIPKWRSISLDGLIMKAMALHDRP